MISLILPPFFKKKQERKFSPLKKDILAKSSFKFSKFFGHFFGLITGNFVEYGGGPRESLKSCEIQIQDLFPLTSISFQLSSALSSTYTQRRQNLSRQIQISSAECKKLSRGPFDPPFRKKNVGACLFSLLRPEGKGGGGYTQRSNSSFLPAWRSVRRQSS